MTKTRKCDNYCCTATCSLAMRSNSLEVSHSPTGSHYLAQDRTCSHWLALARACQNSFTLARPQLASIHSHLLALPLARTRSLTSTCSRSNTFLNSLAWCGQTVQFSLFFVTLFLKRIHLLRSHQILWLASRDMPPSGWIQFRFQFLHMPVFRDLRMCHGAKFQQNQTICDWASELTNSSCCHLPAWIFEKSDGCKVWWR